LPEARIDPAARRLVAHALAAGEELVWAGRPNPAALMRNLWRQAVIAVVLMFAAGVFAVVVIKPDTRSDGIWFVLGSTAAGIALAALIVALSAGRKQSGYGLTRRRAILYLGHAVSPRTETVDIAEIVDRPLIKDLGDGHANVTIRIGPGETDEDTVFQAIADAEAVVALIQRLRADAAPAAKSA